MDKNTLIASVSITIALISYVSYFKGVFSRRIKPHAYSWFIWGTTSGIMFMIQLANGAGAGAWVTGLTSIVCYILVGVGLKGGLQQVHYSDKISLALAIGVVVFWVMTDQPVISLLFGATIEIFGCYPTFRKSYYRPHQEGAFFYFLCGCKYAIALFAIDSYTFLSSFYPAFMVFINLSLTGFLVVRRMQLGIEN